MLECSGGNSLVWGKENIIWVRILTESSLAKIEINVTENYFQLIWLRGTVRTCESNMFSEVLKLFLYYIFN